MDSGTEIKVTHILLIEDDKGHQDLVLRAFRNDPEKFQVSVAGNLREARSILERDLPDLILSDWNLPDGKGLDILIRTDGAVTIPLIIMTGYGDEKLVVEIMKSGAIDYVVKSSTVFHDIPHIVRRALREWENIHERKRADKAVRDSEKRLADIISFLPDAVLAIDNKGRVIAWNEAIEQMTGVAAEKMLGKGNYEYSIPFYGDRRPILIDLILIEDEEIEKKYLTLQRDGERISSEVYIPTLFGGKGAYLWGTASPLYDDAGNRIGAIEIIRNITDRKKAEEALREKEATLETLLNAPKDTIALLDRQGTILGINEQGARRLGGNVPGVTGRCAYDLLPPDVARERKVHIDRVFESGEPSRFDDIRHHMYLHNEIFPIFNAEHTVVDRIAIFARDITFQKQAELALQESETRFKDLFENMSSGVVMYDATPDGNDFIIRDINRAGETIDRVRKNEIIGKSVLAVFPGVVEFGLFAVFQRVAKTGIAESHPVSKYRDDRISGWHENYVYKLPSGEIVAIYDDVTEKKKAEEALRESELRYRSVIENAAEGITVAQEGKLQYANTRLLEMTQISPGEIVNRPFTDFIHPDDRALVFERYQRRISGDDPPQNYDFRILGKNGKIVWVQLSAVRIEWNGRPATLNFLMDITERKKAEDALKVAREWLGIALKAAHAGTWDWNMLTGQLTWSQEFFELFNLPPGTTASFKTWLDALHPDDREPAQAKIEESVKGHTPLWNEYRILLPDGDLRWIGAAGSTSYNEAGEPLRMSGVCIDITNRKQAELALQESQERYRILFNSIDEGFCIIEMIFDKNEKPVDYRFLEINPSFEKQTGLIDAKGRRMRELAPKHEDHWFEIYGKIALTGQTARFVNRAEQLHRWYDVYAFRFGQPENRQVAVLFNDITEKIKADEKLRESEDRFRHISELITDIAYSCKRPPGGVFTIDWITGAVGRITGFSDNEILDMGCWRGLVIEEDYPLFDEKITGLSPGLSSQCDLRIRSKDGVIHWLSCFTECVSDPAHTGYHILFGGCRDITENKKSEEIRNAYRVRLDSAMDIGSLAWWEMDLPDGAVRFDDRKATMLGYSPDRFHHYTDFTALLHPADLGPAMQAMRDHLEGKEAHYHTDYRIRAAAGDYRWFQDVGGITKSHADGSPATVTGIVIDMTASKVAEEKLRESEERLTLSLEATRDGLWDWNLAKDHVFWSPRAYEMLGYAPDEFSVNFAVWKSLIHPDEREATEKNVLHQLKENQHFSAEFRYRMKDGSWMWILGRGRAVAWDTEGNATRMVGTHVDLTGQKQAEKVLRDNQARLATAMDIAGLVDWEYDVRSGMFTFDDRFYALYETTADREGGNQMSAETYMREFVYPDDRPAVLAAIQKLLATTDPAYSGQMEHRIIPRDGSVRTIITRFAPIMGPDGKVVQIFGANQDITDRMLMESEIRSLNTVLEQRVKDRTEDLIETNKKLKQENAQRLAAEGKLQASYDEKVMLLKEIHHRVKNNLQIIASLLNLQSRYISDEKTLAAIRESQNRVKAMALVHEKLYRSEDIAHISLHDYIKFLGTGLFQFYDARVRGIQFKLEINDIDVDIDAAIPLGLIINELISNSLKYAFPEGKTGEVSISVKKEGHTLNVLFHDTGIGIPVNLDWRNAPSLGLRLVTTLVDQMDGTLELDRSDGTTFTMVLHEKEPRGEK